MRLSASAAVLAALLSLFGVACSKAPAPEGVLHLDPKLEDGSSSAERLAMTRTVVAEWKIENAQSDLGPWSLRNFMSVDARGGRPGMLVGDTEVAPGVFPRILLVWEGELLARDVNRLELDLLKYHRGGVRVSWIREDDPPELADDPHSLELTIDETEEQVSRGFPVGTHSEWQGVITRIVITLATSGPQRFELSAMRFLSVGFSMGPDPLLAEDGFLWGENPAGPELSLDLPSRPEPQRSACDGGLVAQGGAMRRAWPTDWNVPLFDACTVPRGGLLTVDTSIPGLLSGYEGEIHFAIDLRSPQGTWVEVATRIFRPVWEEDPTRWVPLLADLSRFEGQEVQLRFRNFASDREIPPPYPEDGEELDAEAQAEKRQEFYLRDSQNIGLGGELVRTRAFWGNPLVLGEMSKKRPPNIVLVTLDTMRNDRVGPLEATEGWSAGSTPVLAELAGVGVHFEEAWSPKNSTSEAHASILTGLDLHDHGVIDNFSVMSPAASSLAERLRQRGYETAAAVSVPHLQAGRSGFGQGFDRFQLCAPLAPVNGGITLATVQSWIDEWVTVGERPTFLWIHFFDPHTPYKSPLPWQAEWAELSGRPEPPKLAEPGPDGQPADREFPPSPFTQKGRFLWDVTKLEWPLWQYDAGVAYTDLLVREVHAELRDQGLWSDTALFVTADHGESLGEHDRYFHHTSLFEETTRVPLFMVLPER
ncbi:MAG: sulfatase, partial [Planctomycetota bacterium]